MSERTVAELKHYNTHVYTLKVGIHKNRKQLYSGIYWQTVSLGVL